MTPSSYRFTVRLMLARRMVNATKKIAVTLSEPKEDSDLNKESFDVTATASFLSPQFELRCGFAFNRPAQWAGGNPEPDHQWIGMPGVVTWNHIVVSICGSHQLLIRPSILIIAALAFATDVACIVYEWNYQCLGSYSKWR